MALQHSRQIGYSLLAGFYDPHLVATLSHFTVTFLMSRILEMNTYIPVSMEVFLKPFSFAFSCARDVVGVASITEAPGAAGLNVIHDNFAHSLRGNRYARSV